VLTLCLLRTEVSYPHSRSGNLLLREPEYVAIVHTSGHFRRQPPGPPF
jgi:hypothetical protein